MISWLEKIKINGSKMNEDRLNMSGQNWGMTPA